ncbi:MAG: PilZ domain-containing protein [Phycisphaerae bacterium]|nr:PilZ domain-containing protein [Phycisphaerae bacterium]
MSAPDERRSHRRKTLACPVRMFDRGGRPLTNGRTIDLSDGGLFISTSLTAMKTLPRRVNVTVSLPRSTPNTYMLEEVAAGAVVVRQQPMVDEGAAGVALQFERPVELGLKG